ncbi:channel protein (hemolysin III family) [Acidovorax sp. 69]|uniref:PAQR family membrane homeostasis protein TrhA n=1 Tax=Acidovorax sp. 69 TaxID=2035202 RepID=UPI000C244A99|nr:hemolysin III family protein [Acidovorax sp. 69]PJI96177.1 channel protein (hemolysin III family) [Acidovorax sp. 69]
MQQRQQDMAEEIANSVLHGATLLGAFLAAPRLLASATPANASAHTGLWIFVTTMTLLYGASTLYHAMPEGRSKQWLLRLDNAAIYLFIAGSYTPFALLSPGDSTRSVQLTLVWLAAAAGFAVKVRALHMPPLLSTALYVTMGWLVLLAALPLMAQLPAVSTAWLVIGGVAYTVGVVFFVLDTAVRYAHAIWHGFVAAGTGCHIVAVLGLSQPLQA